MNMKNNYYSPTPIRWRKLGDALLAASTMLSTYAVADEWGKSTTIIIILIGVLGKFISNLFSEETPNA